MANSQKSPEKEGASRGDQGSMTDEKEMLDNSEVTGKVTNRYAATNLQESQMEDENLTSDFLMESQNKFVNTLIQNLCWFIIGSFRFCNLSCSFLLF